MHSVIPLQRQKPLRPETASPRRHPQIGSCVGVVEGASEGAVSRAAAAVPDPALRHLPVLLRQADPREMHSDIYRHIQHPS